MIGCGRWGANLKRVLEGLGQTVFIYDPARADSVESPVELVKMSDGIVVATPPQHHASGASLAVEFDKPVLVEKPLALAPIDAAVLAQAAFWGNIQLAVGHTALFADDYPQGGFSKIRAHRTGTNPGYHGVSAWWDLGVHDVAVCVDQFGPPQDVVVEVMEAETYHVRLFWEGRFAELTGDRNARGKEWWFQFDGQDWTPYDSETEPLVREVEWWLNGGSNPTQALTVVEALSRVSPAVQHGSTNITRGGAAESTSNV